MLKTVYETWDTKFYKVPGDAHKLRIVIPRNFYPNHGRILIAELIFQPRTSKTNTYLTYRRIDPKTLVETFDKNYITQIWWKADDFSNIKRVRIALCDVNDDDEDYLKNAIDNLS